MVVVSVVVVEVVVVVVEVDVLIVDVENTVLTAAFDFNVVAVDFVVGLSFDFVKLLAVLLTDFVDEYDTLSVTALNISVFVSMRSSALCKLFE